MDPAGFEPASATWTECHVPVTPRALSGVWATALSKGKTVIRNFVARVPNWDLRCRYLGVNIAWQARFYDFNVWTERKRIEKLRYIRRNPVKAWLGGRS